MKQHTILSSLVLVASLLGLSSVALGYTVIKTQGGQPVYWENPHQQWYLDEDGSEDVEFSKVEREVKRAFQQWTDIPCSSFEAEYMGTTQLDAPELETGANDGQNTIIWKEDNWPDGMPEALAVCLPFFYSEGAQAGLMVDADIIFNGDWENWTAEEEGESGKMDIWSVAQHEMGHFVGLDHSQYADATMYYAVTESDLTKRTLSPDDIQGICSIYPIAGAPMSSCEDDSDCDSGVCVEHDLSHDSICSKECDCYPSCALGLDCQDGYCLPTTETIAIGDPCSQEAPDCGQDLLCLLSSETEGICTAYCEESEDCPEGMNCVGLTNGQSACYGTPVDPNAAAFSIVQFKAEPLQDDGTALTDTDVTLTASVMADSGFHAEYRFLVRQSDEQWRYIDEGFSLEGTFAWNPTVPGDYELRVDVREEGVDACYQDYALMALTVKQNGATGDDDDDDDSADDDDDEGSSGSSGDSGCQSLPGTLGFGLLLSLLGLGFLRHRKVVG